MPSTPHKDVAVLFLNMIVEGKIREAYAQHVGPTFRHHHPLCKGDAASLMKAMEENEVTFPNKSIKICRVLEDDDLVAVHSSVSLGDLEIAVVHILRFANNQIIELWDLGQQVPADSPNENGIF